MKPYILQTKNSSFNKLKIETDDIVGLTFLTVILLCVTMIIVGPICIGIFGMHPLYAALFILESMFIPWTYILFYKINYYLEVIISGHYFKKVQKK